MAQKQEEQLSRCLYYDTYHNQRNGKLLEYMIMGHDTLISVPVRHQLAQKISFQILFYESGISMTIYLKSSEESYIHYMCYLKNSLAAKNYEEYYKMVLFISRFHMIRQVNKMKTLIQLQEISPKEAMPVNKNTEKEYKELIKNYETIIKDINISIDDFVDDMF